MTGHIVGTFFNMTICHMMFRHDTIVDIFHVITHGRIEILIDSQNPQLVCFTNKCNNPIAGSSGRCDVISFVTKWNPRGRGFKIIIVCLIIIFKKYDLVFSFFLLAFRIKSRYFFFIRSHQMKLIFRRMITIFSKHTAINKTPPVSNAGKMP